MDREEPRSMKSEKDMFAAVVDSDLGTIRFTIEPTLEVSG